MTNFALSITRAGIMYFPALLLAFALESEKLSEEWRNYTTPLAKHFRAIK